MHPLQRLLERRIRVLAERWPQVLDGDPTAIHQARVASRRLREAVPVVGASLSARRVRRLYRRVRRLTRRLGPLRERDVALSMIAVLDDAQRSDASELFDVARPELTRGREALRARLADTLDAGRIRRLVERLERFGRALPEPDRTPAWRELLADRIRRRAHALHATVADAGALFLPDRLHAVRIAVKKLRYALELAGEARTAPTGSLVRQLREAQTILGELHDHDVLRELLGRALDVSDPRADLLTVHEQVTAGLAAQARHLHARYLRRQASLIRVADRALDAVAPRVEMTRSSER